MPSLTLSDGFAALNRGDLATAGEACKQALEKDQAQASAHFLVGLVALGRLRSATLHGGAVTTPEVVVECVIFLLALMTWFTIKRQAIERGQSARH